MANIFVAIPQYKKMPEAEIERIAKELRLDGWEPSMSGFHPMFDISIANLCRGKHTIRLCIVNGDGNLPRVRSFQAGVFKWEYENPDIASCDYFMIIDEDISFLPEAIDHLIADDKPIVGGIYTFKTNSERYVGKICTRLLDNEPGDNNGPFRVRWLNGGFIMVQAQTLLDMMQHYADELRFQVGEDSGMGIKESCALWCPKVHVGPNERVFLSEDWAFCQRAHDMGIDVWADWRCKLIHWSGENGFGISFPENIKE